MHTKKVILTVSKNLVKIVGVVLKLLVIDTSNCLFLDMITQYMFQLLNTQLST